MIHDDITDVKGILVGHADDQTALTGCTVVLCEEAATAGVLVAGGAPGTRETDLLRPENMIEKVHAVVLSGGSAFGLDTASGVMQYLESRGIGFETGYAKVPIVPAAVIYDLGIGDAKTRPDAAMGIAACRNASRGPIPQGNVGAGMGATVAKSRGPSFMMKGGLGSASRTLADGTTVGALVAVNCFGDVYDPDTGAMIAGALGNSGKPSNLGGSLGQNTTIGVIAYDGALAKAAASKIAQMAHDGLARSIKPVHTMFDGDTVFCVATAQHNKNLADAAQISHIGAVAAEVMAKAVLNAVRRAKSVAGLKCAADLVI